MGVCFFQNGTNIGASAGWGGFTGNNNYVVRYDFTTGASGASAVTLALSGIYYGNNAGTQGFGFRLSTLPAAYANLRNAAPDSSLGYMSYSGSMGYCCTMTASGLNLSPYTTYYIFVYVATAGSEYYTGWNCTAPQITPSGSYTRPESTISSISPHVTTQNSVSIIMSGTGCWHRAAFTFGGETLAVSEAFGASLSYVCPRAWMSRATDAAVMDVTVSVQAYSDAACTNPFGAAQPGRFTLAADSGMRPVLETGAVSAAVLNTGAAAAFTEFIAGISRARVSFNAAKISLAACAGAEIVRYSLSYKGINAASQSGVVDTGVLPGDCTVCCTVTDSRGREGSADITITMQPYVPPSLTGLSAVRCSASGASDENGAYYKLKGTLKCTSLGGKNSASAAVSIQPAGGEWGAETPLTGFENGVWSNEWSTPAVLGGGLTGDSYNLRLKAKDSLGSVSIYTLRLYRRQWAMKFNAAGTAVGFGMAPTVQDAVQLPDAWKLYAGALVLSENSYGTQTPELAVSEAAEGQLYFYLTD